MTGHLGTFHTSQVSNYYEKLIIRPEEYQGSQHLKNIYGGQNTALIRER